MMDEISQSEPANQSTPRRNSPWPWIVLVIVLTPVLAFIVFAAVALGGVVQAWHAVDNLLAGRLVVRTDQPAIVLQVQQLNRLETASFTIEKVIEGGTNQGPVLNALLGDRLLFIAHGEVIAGVDLSQLGEGDMVVGPDQSVTVRLPGATILSHTLDNQKSRVYDRQVGLLGKGDPNLETQVRQIADQQILQAACEGGILAQANANAQTQVRALLATMGFVRVEFLSPRPIDPSGC